MNTAGQTAVRKRVLLVEDDADTFHFIAAELETAGYAVTSADDGRAGLLTAGTADFDVLVIDRMLPKLDRLALVTAARPSRPRIGRGRMPDKRTDIATPDRPAHRPPPAFSARWRRAAAPPRPP